MGIYPQYRAMKCKSLVLILPLAFIVCQSIPDMVSIDEKTITQHDVSYRLAIDKVYGNDQSGTTEAILQLIMQELREAIMQQEEIYITDSMIEQEALRINNETKAPVRLAEVKAVFADHRDYLKHYVRPILVEKLLQEMFFFDTLYHEESYRIINEAFAQSVNAHIDSTLRILEPNKDQLRYYEHAAKKSIGEDKYSYFFVRQEGGKKRVYFVPKEDYTTWFQAEALKVPVRVHDKELKEKLLNRTRNSDFWQKILSE